MASTHQTMLPKPLLPALWSSSYKATVSHSSPLPFSLEELRVTWDALDLQSDSCFYLGDGAPSPLAVSLRLREHVQTLTVALKCVPPPVLLSFQA